MEENCRKKNWNVKKSAERFKRTRRRTGVLQAVRLKCSSRAKIDRNPQFCGFQPKFLSFQVNTIILQ